jgi:hypothetical protein
LGAEKTVDQIGLEQRFRPRWPTQWAQAGIVTLQAACRSATSAVTIDNEQDQL